MKEFTQTSATQLEKFETCNRQWWFQYVLGIRPPQKGSAAEGERLHKELELYMLDGNPRHLGPLASKGLPYLPEPGTVYVEHPIEIDLAGVKLIGKIDLLDLRSDPDRPAVIDHKKAKDFKWAKTEEELRNNIQVNVYGNVVLDMFRQLELPAPPEVRLQHLVYRSTGAPEVRETHVDVTPEHLRAQWARLEGVTKSMQGVAKIPTPDRVAPNWGACNQFGGCYFRDKCQALRQGKTISDNADAPGERLFAGIETISTPEDSTMTAEEILANIKRQRAVTQAAQTPATPATAPAGGNPPGPSAKADRLAFLAKMGVRTASEGAAPAPATTTAPPAEGVIPPDAPTEDKRKAVLAAMMQHAEGETTPAPAAAEPAPNPEPPAERRPKGWAAKLKALGWSEAQAKRASLEAVKHILADDLRGDGTYSILPDGSLVTTPQGAGTASAPASAGTPEPNEQVPDATPPAQTAPAKSAEDIVKAAMGVVPEPESGPEPLVLLVDCDVVKGPGAGDATPLEDILAPLMAKVAAAGEDMTFKSPLPSYGMVGYGQGQHRVIGLLMQDPPRSGLIVADSRLPCSAAAIEALAPLAQQVVRGRR